jgi:dynein heavy chain
MLSIQKFGVPYKDDIDPLSELADGAKLAEWAGHDLPDDRFSKENAAIIDQAARWPLIIDPQLQAAK